MFTTRYSRGRPRLLGADKEVYVCDSRYNEEKHKLNKIKTWASCLPDEVRDKDYEMDLFDGVKKVKKVPSPILHLLKEDAQETDELPKPQWGADNAPPIIGAVYKGPRDENVSFRKFPFSFVHVIYNNRSNHPLQSQHHPLRRNPHLKYLKQPTTCQPMTRQITVETAKATLSQELPFIHHQSLKPRLHRITIH